MDDLVQRVECYLDLFIDEVTDAKNNNIIVPKDLMDWLIQYSTEAFDKFLVEANNLHYVKRISYGHSKNIIGYLSARVKTEISRNLKGIALLENIAGDSKELSFEKFKFWIMGIISIVSGIIGFLISVFYPNCADKVRILLGIT